VCAFFDGLVRCASRDNVMAYREPVISSSGVRGSWCFTDDLAQQQHTLGKVDIANKGRQEI
jgi:hypothetical protein